MTAAAKKKRRVLLCGKVRFYSPLYLKAWKSVTCTKIQTYKGLIQAKELVCSRNKIFPSFRKPHRGMLLSTGVRNFYSAEIAVRTALFSFLSRFSSALQLGYWIYKYTRCICIQKLQTRRDMFLVCLSGSQFLRNDLSNNSHDWLQDLSSYSFLLPSEQKKLGSKNQTELKNA